VEKLDWVGRKAFVRRVDADYYTDAIDYTKLKVLDEFEHAAGKAERASHGEVHVIRRVAGYKKIRYYTHENIGYGNVNLPDLEMHTTAVWWQLDPSTLAKAFATRHQAIDGFLGAAYALHHIAALVSLAELRDIGRSVGDGNGAWSAVVDARGRGTIRAQNGSELDIEHSPSFKPTLFLYDNYPGGIGIAVPLFDQRHAVIERAIQLVSSCRCTQGCPACIGPIPHAPVPKANDAQPILAPRAAAERVLTLLSSVHETQSLTQVIAI
jgi:DEAD/DEAH box helicase domain-containing protein